MRLKPNLVISLFILQHEDFSVKQKPASEHLLLKDHEIDICFAREAIQLPIPPLKTTENLHHSLRER